LTNWGELYLRGIGSNRQMHVSFEEAFITKAGKIFTIS